MVVGKVAGKVAGEVAGEAVGRLPLRSAVGLGMTPVISAPGTVGPVVDPSQATAAKPRTVIVAIIVQRNLNFMSGLRKVGNR